MRPSSGAGTEDSRLRPEITPSCQEQDEVPHFHFVELVGTHICTGLNAGHKGAIVEKKLLQSRRSAAGPHSPAVSFFVDMSTTVRNVIPMRIDLDCSVHLSTYSLLSSTRVMHVDRGLMPLQTGSRPTPPNS